MASPWAQVLGAGLAGNSINMAAQAEPARSSVRLTASKGGRWDSMQQDDAAETKRHDESARTPVAGKKGVTAKKVLEHIDPERLSKAIRYLKEHPKFVR
jgi:hypothetical protein